MEQKKFFRKNSKEDLGQNVSSRILKKAKITDSFEYPESVSTRPEKIYNCFKYISKDKINSFNKNNSSFLSQELSIETCITFSKPQKYISELKISHVHSFRYHPDKFLEEISRSSSYIPSQKISFGTLNVSSKNFFLKNKLGQDEGNISLNRHKSKFSFNRKCKTQNFSKQIKQINKTLLVNSIPIENKIKEEEISIQEKDSISKFINCLFGVKKKISLASDSASNQLLQSISRDFNSSN